MGLTDIMEGFHASSMSAHEKGEHIIELLGDIVDGLGNLNDAIRAEDDQDTFIPYVFQGTTDGTGALTVILERRPGYVLELVSLSATGAAVSSGLLIYVNAVTPDNLLYAGTNSTFFSDNFPEGSVVPDGSKLIAVWVAAGAAANVTATIRGKKRRLDGGRPLEVVA